MKIGVKCKLLCAVLMMGFIYKYVMYIALAGMMSNALWESSDILKVAIS